MNILASLVILTLVNLPSINGQECDPDCINRHKDCVVYGSDPSAKPVDCSNDLHINRCPRKCEACAPCEYADTQVVSTTLDTIRTDATEVENKVEQLNKLMTSEGEASS